MERMVRANDVELCTETFGTSDDPAILLIGGRSASMDFWDARFCERLAEGGRYVVRYDHRDTGRSVAYPPGEPGYTVADLVEDAVGILDALGLERAHVVGISMGGALAQVLALAHPQRVESLTLLSTTTAFDDGVGDFPPIGEAMAEFFASAGDRPEVDPDDRDAVIEQLLADLRAFAPNGLDEDRMRTVLGAVVDRTPSLATMANHGLLDPGPMPVGGLADIAAPTLVLHGTSDPLFPIGHGEELARLIPSAALIRLDGVGHEEPPERTWPIVVPTLLRHTSGDYPPAELPHLAAADRDPTGWFEDFYAGAASGAYEMPWSRTQGHPLLSGWMEGHGISGPGRAVVVGCALGADAEYVASRGFETTAFDVSPTAVRAASERHAGSSVTYAVADLLDLPSDWQGRFDLVVEIITVQALPDDLRGHAIAAVRGLVAAGGTLFVVALRDTPRTRTSPPPPSPLDRGDIDAFAADGLVAVSVEELDEPFPRWRAVFARTDLPARQDGSEAARSSTAASP